MRSLRSISLLARSICLGITLLGFCAYGASNGPVGQGPLVGKKAPAFQVRGIYSEPYTLDSFKGHILVMQFGASW